MNPPIGSLVTIVFTNNQAFEGIVREWSDEKSVILSPDKKSFAIIQNTLRDVIIVKVHGMSKEHVPRSNPRQEEEYEARVSSMGRDPKALREIAELKKRHNTRERQQYVNQLRSPEIPNAGSHYQPFYAAKTMRTPNVVEDDMGIDDEYSDLTDVFDTE